MNSRKHTHFASATMGASVFLTVLLFGTFWRLGALHAIRSRHRMISGLGRAAIFQF